MRMRMPAIAIRIGRIDCAGNKQPSCQLEDGDSFASHQERLEITWVCTYHDCLICSRIGHSQRHLKRNKPSQLEREGEREIDRLEPKPQPKPQHGRAVGRRQFPEPWVLAFFLSMSLPKYHFPAAADSHICFPLQLPTRHCTGVTLYVCMYVCMLCTIPIG